MGCKLPKLRHSAEAPGKIYSTLHRTQVETEVDVAYTYHFLDFLLGKEEVPVSSVLYLSSVRELPVQVCELYEQGFILAAVHPFVHCAGPASTSLQRQLHRAVLIREIRSSAENGVLNRTSPRLQTDVCFSGNQLPDPDVIQGYIKKVQDLADQGVLFLGFLKQPGSGPFFGGRWDSEELSSLHSSPSSLHQQSTNLLLSPACEQNQGRQKDPHHKNLPNTDKPQTTELKTQEIPKEDHQVQDQLNNQNSEKQSPESTQSSDHQDLVHSKNTEYSLTPARVRPELLLSESDHVQDSIMSIANPKTQEPNHTSRVHSPDKPEHWARTIHPVHHVQLFALYNQTMGPSGPYRFYSLRIPLQVEREAGLVTTVDAHWLDHLTKHFRNGAQLIDGYFNMGDDTEASITEGVFIFQKDSKDDIPPTVYDAIVVEQWTTIDGVSVKTDYIPLLQSLAPYGWRLMCVLPTPVIKSNSDGSLTTKQILFLQRPVLPRKRRDLTKLHLRMRNKRNIYSGEQAESETVRNTTPPATIEREMRKIESGVGTAEFLLSGVGTAEFLLSGVGTAEDSITQISQGYEDTERCGEQQEELRLIFSEQPLFSGVC
ncbi:raftlin [Chanos chanos]|uniref:Raftlin n=1 Tax=Chanos chanos TaxID=29144 RepID=A0A6J2WME9_CHACN|nr:raftlin [Chanos chanos]